MAVGIELLELNSDIATRETAGDLAFFEGLLSPEFVMRRAKETVDLATGGAVLRTYSGRKDYLKGVEKSSPRETAGITEVYSCSTISVVACVVRMEVGGGSWASFRNVRMFARESAGSPWHLMAWANEPIVDR